MPYSAEISRTNPACFLFLVIQCMTVPDYSADAVNRVVNTLSQRCSSGLDIRDYFHIGILGFTTGGFLGMGGIKNTYTLPGTNPERPFLPISQVVEVAEIEEKRVKEDYGGGEVVEVTRRMPVWLRHHIGGLDPMREMLRSMQQPLVERIDQHRNSQVEAHRIRNLRTRDGNVLLFTVHLSHNEDSRPTMFPSQEEGLLSLGEGKDDSKMMFRMTSPLPEGSRRAAASMGFNVDENSRGLILNGDAVALAQFLDIGTRGPSNLH